MLKGMDKIIILLQLGCIATTIESSCHEENKFGRSCRLSCNCKNELKNDCEDGWYGSTCQKRNLALNKFTNQTSVGHRGYSKNAVDGIKGKDFINKIFLCTHGKGDENYPWWYVDLNKTVAVKTMKIYNRKGEHRDRMNGIQIRVGNSTEFKKDIAKMTENTICYQHNGTYLIDEEAVVCPSVIYGRFVIVWRNKTNVRMNICELEVYQCADFTFGRDCASECKCFSETEVCDRSTGACPLSGCDRGYTGTNCSKECDASRFGKNCEKRCHCKQKACNRTYGHCEEGCANGWMGDTCSEKCTQERYGENCSEPCGHCRGACNHTNGFCDGILCKPGWKGDLCKEECSQHFYGENCSEKCGNCKENDTCNHETGICPDSLCKNGWRAPLCQEKENFHVIIVVAVFVTVLLAILVGVSFFLWKRKTSANKEQTVKFLKKNENSSVVVSNQDDNDSLTNVYGNLAEQQGVNISDLCDFMLQKLNSPSAIITEFKALPSAQTHPQTVGSQHSNKDKNRFKNILPYDYTRVMLTESECFKSSYINASYIDGFQREKKYIAAQGPMAKTIVDFWRMVWQENCQKIIMLTELNEKNKKKCEKYWPDNKETTEYGFVQVCTMETEEYNDFIIRKLKVTVNGDSRILKQFQFTVWPDHGVPKHYTSLVAFRNKFYLTCSMDEGPIIVHCTAGVGRTGTFIALDYLVEEGLEKGFVDIVKCINTLRQQRPLMIQNKEQYYFLHILLVEALVFCNEIQLDDFHRVWVEMRQMKTEAPLRLEFEKIRKYQVIYKNHDFKTSKENMKKNRDPNILATQEHRVVLNMYVQGCNNYINAVSIPGYLSCSFIVTQMPLQKTVIDFWRLVYENNSQTIVMLNNCDTSSDAAAYWPEVGDQEVFGPFTVHRLSSNKSDCCTTTKLSVFYEKNPSKSLTVAIFQCHYWKENMEFPSSLEPFFQMIAKIQCWNKQLQDSTTIVHCLNGAKKSGLFCALWNILDRVNADKVVDVLQVVRSLTLVRNEFIETYVQYEFCYLTIAHFLEKNEIYANL